MPAPFSLTINGGSNLLEMRSPSSPTTPYVLPSSINLSKSGDGMGDTMRFSVLQDTTPSGTTPWWSSTPDQALIRFTDSELTGAGGTTLFRGRITNISARMNESGTGTIAEVEASDANAILDQVVIYKGRTGTGIAGGGVYTLKVGSGKTDKAIITTLLSYVRGDATTRALFDDRVLTGISSTATSLPAMVFQFGTLRAALDNIVQEAQAKDGIQRRYYIDTTTQAGGGGRLVYGKAPAASGQYPTAPLEIRTANAGDPGPAVATGTTRAATSGASTAASTIAPRGLELASDHDSAKKVAYFLTADGSDGDSDTDPYRRTYTQTGIAYPTRSGSYTSEAVIQAPWIRGTKSERTSRITATAKAYFGSFNAPTRTITFTIRGSGSQPWNAYGYAAGWAQTGPTTYAFVDRWDPGQWVRIVAPELGLTYDGANPELSLYRVERVEMSFSGASMGREFRITCERRPRGLLSRYVSALRT